jgi:DNA-binding beta-propeller fold protein YncE
MSGAMNERAGRGNAGGARRACRAAAVCVLLLLTAACATEWTLRTAGPDIALQWPYQPASPKVTFERSLSGFAEHRGGAGALRAIAYGRDSQERNTFVLPVAVATGSDGRMAVADMGRRSVHLYLPASKTYLRLNGTKDQKMASPVGVAFDEGLDLFVSDSGGRVFAFGPGGEFMFVLTAAGKEALQRPTGLAYSPRSRLLFVVDTMAHRIHAFTTTGDYVRSFGQRGEGRGQFNYPTHIFWAPPGELYVTNSLDFRIEIVDESGLPRGSFGHHGDGSGDLAMPKGVAVDGDGVVYVADSIFDNVQLFNRAGDFLLTVGGRGVDFGQFWLPAGLFISAEGELYVCDTYNRRIQVFRITVPYGHDAS